MEEFGDFLLSIGFAEDGLVKLHKASEISPHNETLLLKIADAYRMIQQWDAAETQIRNALEASLNNPILYERLANVLLESGKKEEAVQSLKNQANLTSDNLSILIQIRDLLQDLNKHNDIVNVCRSNPEKGTA